MATGSRTPWVRQQFFDDNGNPLSGGLIDTYIAGSTTPINTYTDITLTTIHTNPIVLNTRGETTIFLDPTVAYKFVLRNPLPDGSEIWTQDNITALGGNSLLTDLGVIRSKVVGSTTLPVPLATNVVIPYDTADYEINLTGFNGAANKWVCALDGVYNLNAAVDFTIQSSSGVPSASCEIFFLVNGVTSKNPKKWSFTTGTGGGQKTLETSGTLQLNKNDEVQVVFISATQGSGTSINLIFSNAFWDIISLSGVKGNTGDQGPAGVGIPTGGTANQVLAKIDATDYNTQWVNDTSSPSQGAQNVFNVANGSGGWTALNSVSLPIFFRYDPVDGLIKNTGAPIYTDGAISTDSYTINNNTGQIIFAESGSSVITTEMGRLEVNKDSLGTGLHALEVQGFKQLYLGLVDFHVGGEIKFPGLVDPGTDTNKTMLVVDSTSGVVQKRPIPTSGGSPSQGVQYVVNVADGSGGWIALDGSSVPLFKLDSTTGILNFTGASGFLTNILQATDYININDDAGSLNFKDSSNSSMVDLSVQKDLHGTGLHQLDVNGANKFNIDSEIKIITFDPGTDTNKVMLVQDTNTRLVEKRPIPSSTDNTKLAILNNLSDLNSVPTARTNLGLGTAALLDVGTSATNIVQLDALAKLPAVDGSQLTNILATDNTKLAILNNLSDLNNSTTARTNLGLGTAAVLNTGTGANNIVQLDGTSKLPAVDGSQLTNLPSSGSPSQGSQYDFNYADGSGGWTALSSPRFYFDNSSNVIKYDYHIQASNLLATFEMSLNYDLGQFRFKDTAGTTTLAMLNVVKDGSGTGLHDLLITLCEKVQINSKVIIGDDLSASGDVQFTSLIDSGTNTNKEMVVWDNTTAKLERRPIPSGGGGGTTSLGVIHANFSTSGTLPISNAVNTKIPFNNLDYSSNLTGFSSSNYEWTCPTDGVYQSSASVTFSFGTTTSAFAELKGRLYFQVVKTDGTGYQVGLKTNNYAPNLTSVFNTIQTTSTFDFSQGDKLSVYFIADFPSNNTCAIQHTSSSTDWDIISLNAPSGGGILTPSPMPVMVLKSNAADAGFGPTIGSLIVPWNIETYKDTGFSHSNTTNTTRAIVDNDGTYLIQGRLRVFNSVNQRAQPIVNILKNGVLLQGALDSSYIRNASGASDYWTLSFTYEPLKLLANDYIEVELDLDIGSTSTFNSSLLKAADSSLSIINLQGEKGEKGDQGTSASVRVTSTNTTSSLTIDYDTTDQYNVTALAENITINNPGVSSPASDGFKLILRITPTGSYTITWNSNFRAIGNTLPTSTTANKEIYVGFIYNSSNSSWDVVAVSEMV